ncbi:hypothetical protein PVL29_000088 [Vitis rotundifolia]|uniref:Uncharacterized protein n=1 Tax=Vitis rotundifolia TaxID=103349 RepID=A0AA39E480_VITRO|nr:hypothetical protein PVL29_000088 [Vitis rotundifolia]
MNFSFPLSSTGFSLSILLRELRRIEAMMRDADARKDYDNRFNVWIQEVRTEAYAIEDVLDLFRLHRDQESVWRHLKMRHSISNLIQDINTRLAIRQRRGIRSWSPLQLVRKPTHTLNVRVVPLIPGRGDNTVGIDEPKRKLVSWALESNQKLKIMFTVGMAGLGKTTLARSLYEEVNKRKLVSWALEPNQKLKVMFVVGMAGLGKTTLARSVYEEVGEEYLNELIGRPLIKANEMDFDERPITVGVHSLMHQKETWLTNPSAYPSKRETLMCLRT